MKKGERKTNEDAVIPSSEYYVPKKKERVDKDAQAKLRSEKAQKKRDKKRNQKIVEKKQKEEEYNSILKSLEQSAQQIEDDKVCY